MERKRREGEKEGREGKGREGKGKEGKGCFPNHGPNMPYRTILFLLLLISIILEGFSLLKMESFSSKLSG